MKEYIFCVGKYDKDEDGVWHCGYEVRVAKDGGCSYEVAGDLAKDLAKDKDGVWHFNYEDQSVTYEDSLEETIDQLTDEFENGKTDNMALSFGSFSYKK